MSLPDPTRDGAEPRTHLETFENPNPDTDYTVRISIPEFTCLCPKTGQPDFATLEIEYVPDSRCVELKSLKYYLLQFRNVGMFYEHVSNRILDDLVLMLKPKKMEVTGQFTSRGGLTATVCSRYEATT